MTKVSELASSTGHSPGPGNALGLEEDRIRSIIRAQLQQGESHAEEIGFDTPILGMGLGLDSLEALALTAEIEAEFGILIDDDELSPDLFQSIRTLAEHVRKKLATNNGWENQDDHAA